MITVLVSIYNSGRWIENRLDNIFSSTIKNNLNVVCINANSPDPLDDSVPRKFPCKYMKLNNDLSLYDTWNQIIKDHSTEYYTNANTDDIVSPNAYEKMLNIISKDRDLGCIYPSWHTTHIDNLKWADTANPNKCDHNGGQPGQFAGDVSRASPGHFPMWRRQLHDAVGYFDPSFTALADAHFWCRVHYKTKYKFLWLNEPLGCYLWRQGDNLWNRKISTEQWQRFHAEIAALRNPS